VNIFHKSYGNPNGSSIVFIHGGGMRSDVWKNNLKHFKDFHCIVVDLPEHGRSSGIKPFTMADSSRYIADVINKTANNGKAHVVGHSLGGMVVVKLLSHFSNCVDRAVIASGNLRPSLFYTILSYHLKNLGQVKTTNPN
jgi:pimeloyl-ACP methyl ester carboxylesterase